MTGTVHRVRAAGAFRRLAGISALLLVLAGGRAEPAGADNTAAALEAAGWSESAPGLLASLPERTAKIGGSEIGGEFALAAGTSLAWERRFRDAPGPGTALEIEMVSDGTNPSSDDYRENRAVFPVSATAVFGRDSVDVPLKTRVLDFLAGFWRGFRPRGVRLTYAAGNVAPVGSMYRLGEEETVFIVAGVEEKGKRISIRRDLVADFQAAYGRAPRGPVTRLVVRAARPSREKGTIRSEIRLAFPGK